MGRAFRIRAKRTPEEAVDRLRFNSVPARVQVKAIRFWFDGTWAYTAECTGCPFERVGEWEKMISEADYHSRTDHGKHLLRLTTF